MFSDLHVIESKTDAEFLKLNNPKAPLFNSFTAAIGFLDPAGEGPAGQHCVILGGIQQDERFLILDEQSGDIVSVLEATLSFKDRFLVKEIWAEMDNLSLASIIWKTDGLSQYQSYGKDPVGQEIWWHPSSYWPHFRSRDHIAMVGNVPLDVRASTTTGDKVVEMSKAEQLLVHPRCVNVQWCLDQPKPSDVSNHPVFKALVYLVWARERQLEKDKITKVEAKITAYKNLNKRKY